MAVVVVVAVALLVGAEEEVMVKIRLPQHMLDPGTFSISITITMIGSRRMFHPHKISTLASTDGITTTTAEMAAASILAETGLIIAVATASTSIRRLRRLAKSLDDSVPRQVS